MTNLKSIATLLPLLAATASLASSNAQQQPTRANFPARVGQTWQIDVASPSKPLRWVLKFTALDKDNIPTGSAELEGFRGQAEWNNVGQKNHGFVFTEAPGRFAGSTGVWVCVFPRHVAELFGSSLQGVAAYQVSSGLTGNTTCKATLLSDPNPTPAIPTPPAFDAKSILPPRPGQRWQIKLSSSEFLRVQLIGYVTTDRIEGTVEGNTVVGGYEHPSSTVPTSLGAFYLRQGEKILATCQISTDSMLEVKGGTHEITGKLAGSAGACVVSFAQP